MRNLDSNEIIIHNLKQCNYRDEIENLINGIQDEELQELVKKEYDTTLKEMLKIGCCERNIIETIKNKLEIIVEENIKKDYSSLKEVIKDIEKRYEEEKNLMIKEIQKNNVDIQEYVEELFLFNELLQFLKYEDENVETGMKTRLDKKDYDILREYWDLASGFSEMYYNTEDFSTSYDSIEKILKELVFEWQENNKEVD